MEFSKDVYLTTVWQKKENQRPKNQTEQTKQKIKMTDLSPNISMTALNVNVNQYYFKC